MLSMYPGNARMKSAGASGAEGGAIGLALGNGLVVLNADFCGAAVAVDSVVLAVGNIAAYAGIVFVLVIFHDSSSCWFCHG